MKDGRVDQMSLVIQSSENSVVQAVQMNKVGLLGQPNGNPIFPPKMGSQMPYWKFEKTYLQIVVIVSRSTW